MKDINSILSDMGIEVPEDKKEGLRKAVAENYKTVADYNKKVDALARAENEANTAKEAIAKFEGIDPDKVKEEIETYKKQVKDIEDKYKQESEARLFNDAAETLLGSYTFSSKAARAQVLNRLKESGLKVVDGAIMGGKDYMAKLQEEDGEAFKAVDAPQFTNPQMSGGTPNPAMTRETIMAIKDSAQRQREIANNIHLFRK